MKLSLVVLLQDPVLHPNGLSNMWTTIKGAEPPSIPFEPFVCTKNKDNENVSVFKLCTNPGDNESPTYDMKVLTFKLGVIEEYILWKKDLAKV
jgi:hypothetical protein